MRFFGAMLLSLNDNSLKFSLLEDLFDNTLDSCDTISEVVLLLSWCVSSSDDSQSIAWDKEVLRQKSNLSKT